MKTELDSQTKQLLQEVAGITGVDIKLVNTVLENLLIAWLLKILKESLIISSSIYIKMTI